MASHRHHHSSGSGSSKRAKLWLIGIWIVLEVLDTWVYLACPPMNDLSHRKVFGATLNSMLWQTVLLGAIWARQNWARYVLVFCLLFRVVIDFVIFSEFTQNSFLSGKLSMWIPTNTMIVSLVVAVILIKSRDIHRLTNRAYV